MHSIGISDSRIQILKRLTSLTFTDDDIFGPIRAWHEFGIAVALVTVVRTLGSSPRPVGSHLAVNETARLAESVSGGCIE